MVYGDDDVGHVLDFFVEIFKDFHAEGANSAPCAGAFLNDLCARIELWGWLVWLWCFALWCFALWCFVIQFALKLWLWCRGVELR